MGETNLGRLEGLNKSSDRIEFVLHTKELSQDLRSMVTLAGDDL